MWLDEAQRRNLFSLAAEELNDHQARVKNPGSILSCWDETFPDGIDQAIWCWLKTPGSLTLCFLIFRLKRESLFFVPVHGHLRWLRLDPEGLWQSHKPIHRWRVDYQWRRLEAELLTGSWNSSFVVNIPWRSAVCRYFKRAPSSGSNCRDNCSVSSFVAIPSK